MQGDMREEDGLDAFFAAARRDAPPTPRVELVNRILADAADHAPAPAATVRLPERAGLADRVRGLFAPLGGWPAAAALGLCAALGLAGGLLGGAERGSDALWDVAGAEDEPATAILAFYDLANAEG
jgi:hypothetical protein